MSSHATVVYHVIRVAGDAETQAAAARAIRGTSDDTTWSSQKLRMDYFTGETRNFIEYAKGQSRKDKHLLNGGFHQEQIDYDSELPDGGRNLVVAKAINTRLARGAQYYGPGVSDDDDEEEEKKKVVKKPSSTGKRGRGRPPKSSSSIATTSTSANVTVASVVQAKDSGDEEDEVPAAKRGRGRPPSSYRKPVKPYMSKGRPRGRPSKGKKDEEEDEESSVSRYGSGSDGEAEESKEPVAAEKTPVDESVEHQEDEV